LVERILRNLVENAIRYTESGRVLIGCRRTGNGLRIEVLDTGIGIPPQERQRLLQPFAQVEPTSQSPRDSSGLGLPISHQLCLQMGGSLSLHGRTGPGCEVQVRLTLPGRTAVAPRPVAATPAAAQLPLD
ncbi:ATP-binding protein, partial [Pseudomonas sp. SIMBA_077]